MLKCTLLIIASCSAAAAEPQQDGQSAPSVRHLAHAPFPVCAAHELRYEIEAVFDQGRASSLQFWVWFMPTGRKLKKAESVFHVHPALPDGPSPAVLIGHPSNPNGFLF